MDKERKDYYKSLLLAHKTRILNSGVLRSREDLEVSADDLADEADLATSVINQQVSFNLRSMEMAKLKAIEEALWRIDHDEFGYCEECGDEIGEKRLQNQPWVSLCITHAEEQERLISQKGRIA